MLQDSLVTVALQIFFGSLQHHRQRLLQEKCFAGLQLRQKGIAVASNGAASDTSDTLLPWVDFAMILGRCQPALSSVRQC